MTIPISTFQPKQLVDGFNREYYYLRLSITDMCNFRCTYCLPNGYQVPQQREKFLTSSEIYLLVKAFSAMGTKKIRLTGGEPTLRKDFLQIVERIRSLEDIQTIALTTNGYRMAKEVAQWKAAGVNAINVSVDSLDPRMFQSITGTNQFQQVMNGIDRAFECGYEKIKVNSVLLKDLNHQEFAQFLQWIKHRPIQMRFIELMQTGEMDSYFSRYHYSGQVFANQLLQSGWQLQQKNITDGPAKVFHHPDYQGEIGLIMPYEKNFCQSCNRLRVSARGKFHLCLFGEEGIDLRDLLQDESQQFALQARLWSSLQHKREHHFLHKGDTGIRTNLASIGG